MLLVEPVVGAIDSVAGHGGSAASRLFPIVRRSTARAALRAATHDIHERMHHHPALSRLAAGTIKRDEYRRLLARSYGFYAMVEPLLGLAGNSTERLRHDLTTVGLTPAAIDDLPRCAPVAVDQDLAGLIGARYVVLGASLGGKVMARAMSGRTDGDASLPVRFLMGADENEWKIFATDLEKSLPDAGSRTCAATAAAAVFAAYEKWMTWRE